jgi:protein-tyrosine phosphatase
VVAELVTRLRRAPERMLHGWRRRRMREMLRRRPPPATLLVVCHGNVCRSPFAAALLRPSLSRKGVRVDSAGFVGPGRRSPLEAVTAAARYGVDLSTHRSTVLTVDRVRPASIIVVTDPAQGREIRARFGRAEDDVVVLGDFDPQPIDSRKIRDPVNQPLEVFEETYARIERCIRELERAIGSLGVTRSDG